VSESLDAVGADAREAGRVPVYVGWDGAVRGVLVVGDEVREAGEAVVEDLAADGRRVVVLTGDSPAAARRFEEHPAIDETFAEVPPEAKAETVRRLTATERVAMVGDGSNDAPALAAADIGISVASGTDLAADAADAVLLEDRLSAIPELFAVTRGTNRRLKQNLGWAFVYNAVAIPMAVSGSSIHFSPRSRWGRAASSWCRTPREPFIKASSGRRRLRGCRRSRRYAAAPTYGFTARTMASTSYSSSVLSKTTSPSARTTNTPSSPVTNATSSILAELLEDRLRDISGAVQHAARDAVLDFDAGHTRNVGARAVLKEASGGTSLLDHRAQTTSASNTTANSRRPR